MRVDDRLPCALLLAAVLALTLACGDSGGGAPDAAPTPTPDAPKADAPTAPEPAPAPAEPVPAEPAGAPDPVAGEMNYKLYCATCHGEDGCGDGPGAAGLDPKPAKHCDGSYMNALSDAHLFKVIKEGGAAVGKSPLMTPWGGTLTDEQIHDLVAYIRTVAKPPYPGS
jgi:cytochrome c oxidase cbb3-type subunit 3